MALHCGSSWGTWYTPLNYSGLSSACCGTSSTSSRSTSWWSRPFLWRWTWNYEPARPCSLSWCTTWRQQLSWMRISRTPALEVSRCTEGIFPPASFTMRWESSKNGGSNPSALAPPVSWGSNVPMSSCGTLPSTSGPSTCAQRRIEPWQRGGSLPADSLALSGTRISSARTRLRRRPVENRSAVESWRPKETPSCLVSAQYRRCRRSSMRRPPGDESPLEPGAMPASRV